jgi:hypothetical protein
LAGEDSGCLHPLCTSPGENFVSSQTNILALPLTNATIQTSNNEDWIDAFKYVVPTSTTSDPTDPTLPQLDLYGIDFEMQIRTTVGDPNVVLEASTDDGSLSRGFPPDVGFLIINISKTSMQTLQAATYVGEIVATDAQYTRTAIDLTLTITQGIVR